MSNYSSLKSAIDANIKANGRRDITGPVLNAILNAVVNSLGDGYLFRGVAIPSTNPGTPDQNVAYLAITEGTYTHMGGLSVTDGELSVFSYNGAWSKIPLALVPTKTSQLDNDLRFVTSEEMGESLSSKQDTIQDLSEIRSGSALGATAYQKPSAGIPASDMTTAVQNSLELANSSVQAEPIGSIIPPVNPSEFATKEEVDQLSQKVDGKIYPEFQRGTIDNNTGMPSLTDIRVRTEPILLDRPIKVEISGDVAVLSTYVVFQSTNLGLPKLHPTFPADGIINPIEGYHYVVFVFQRKSDATSNIGIDEVAQNTSFTYQGSLEERVIKIESDVTSIQGNVQSLNNDIITLDVAINGRYNYIDGYYLDANGALVANEGSCVSDYIPVDKDVQINGVTCYYGTYNSSARLCFYDTNKALLNAYGQVSGANSRTIYAYQMASAKYVRLSFTKNYTDAGLFDVFTNIYMWQPAFINGVRGDTDDIIDFVLGDIADVHLVQGYYNSGIPATTPLRLRIDRMILASELPLIVKLPDTVDIRLYGYNLYSTANDYTSFVEYHPVSESNYKELVITSALVGANAGITLTFANATSLSTNITPADGDGIEFKYTLGFAEETDGRLDKIESTLGNGSHIYYGRRQTLKITDESHGATSTMKLEHTYNSYPHTVYNQSMAIWDGKYFCFNDTSAHDGFCVVIDIATNTILEHVTTVPQEIGNSHLNNAVFTDVYYLADDDYPLLLLSRGDYPENGYAMEAFHIVRVTEESGHFVFTHIKKVIVHTAYTHFGPSWCYDRQRKMVWCYSYTQDWRYNRSMFRNFNGYPLPIYSESSYICITSGDNVAAVDTDVEIIVTGVTRTIHVTAGNGFEEVFAFTPNSLGLGVIKVTQSVNNAFTGMWVAYDCDSNGDDKVELVSQSVITGFNSPVLADTTQVELSDDDIVSRSFIDWGIFQGGDCANGKLYLPYQNYSTINGQPTSFTGHCCMILDPLSGYIESIIPTDTLENEGCAIYNGKLYISSHNGNGASTPTSVCFRIIEYSF